LRDKPISKTLHVFMKLEIQQLTRRVIKPPEKTRREINTENAENGGSLKEDAHIG